MPMLILILFLRVRAQDEMTEYERASLFCVSGTYIIVSYVVFREPMTKDRSLRFITD